MRTIQINIKKERPVVRPGGLKRWPVYIVLLICKMLVNGTHPTAVPANIQSQNSNQTFGIRINWEPGERTLVRSTMALRRCVAC